MGKWLSAFWCHDGHYQRLADDNRQATEAYNEEMLSLMARVGALLSLLPLLAVPFSHTKAMLAPAYLLGTSISTALFLLFRFPAMKKYTLAGLYVFFSAFFLFAIYVSLIHSPEMRATILLGVFSVAPMGFIDRPCRMNLFIAFWFVVHTALAFYLKPRYALDDMINCLCFAILGCILGNMMAWARLESYEARRQLIIEKETDVLTGLSNRRKLYEALAELEAGSVEKPSGILMLDIDRFKDFNDNYGHAAADRSLNRFGKVLTQFAQNFRLHFYRYGGEEFVAMAYGYDEKDLFSVAESLRIAVQDMRVEGRRITASIGVAYCGDEQVQNYERVIDRADQAAYAAKHKGRNTVCMEQRGNPGAPVCRPGAMESEPKPAS